MHCPRKRNGGNAAEISGKLSADDAVRLRPIVVDPPVDAKAPLAAPLSIE